MGEIVRPVTARVRVRAPGKINVYLAVGERDDDGYHELATAFQAVSLYEDLTAEHADDITVEVASAAERGTRGHIDTRGVPTDDRNLAVRAARLLAAATGYRGGVALRVSKQVPVAGGMGGGSADAAAALVACDALWQTGLSAAELARLGARLGADVPFALLGGTAVGAGRGDQLSPALAKARFDWVLVTSERGLSTPDVYGELDRARAARVLDIRPATTTPVMDAEVLRALRAGDPDALAGAVRNDLQAPALRLRPDLAHLLEAGVEAGALAGIVSGSGPTLALLARDPAHAVDLQIELGVAGTPSLHVHGPVGGARVVADEA